MAGQSDDEGGVSRRALLRGLVALPVLAGGCRLSLENEDSNVDAGVVGPDGGSTGSELCGPDLCIDLTHPLNAGLVAVGGSRVFTTPKDRIVVVRTSDTNFTSLTAVCTHAGCTVRYVKTSDNFACPCHGSKFTIAGAVMVGPATRSLKTYQNDFDAAASTVTVKL